MTVLLVSVIVVAVHERDEGHESKQQHDNDTNTRQQQEGGERARQERTSAEEERENPRGLSEAFALR
jgi:hypothetical protein